MMTRNSGTLHAGVRRRRRLFLEYAAELLKLRRRTTLFVAGVLSDLRSVSFQLDVVTISTRIYVKRHNLVRDPKYCTFPTDSGLRSKVRVYRQSMRLKVYFTVSKYFLAFE